MLYNKLLLQVGLFVIKILFLMILSLCIINLFKKLKYIASSIEHKNNNSQNFKIVENTSSVEIKEK